MTKRLKMAKDLKPFYELALLAHWEVTRLANNHLRWAPPSGKPVTTPSTAGREDRSLDNSMADLKRAGLDPLPRRTGSKRKHDRRAGSRSRVMVTS